MNHRSGFWRYSYATRRPSLLTLVSGVALALFLITVCPQAARAQSCGSTEGCPSILAIELYGHRDLTCENTCDSQYSECLSGVGGSVVGGTLCCATQYDRCVCDCPPAVPPPPRGPLPGTCRIHDPVDPGSGIFTYDHTDLELNDVIPIKLNRVYRQLDTASRDFGVGMVTNYDFEILFDQSGNYAWADLVLPDAGRIHYTRVSTGTYYLGAVFVNYSSPTKYYGSTLTVGSGGTTIVLKNGTKMTFGPESMLVGITDRNGNTVSISRDSDANPISITSPNGRWISLTYDSNNRVIEAQDDSGRAVSYTYNSNGQLSSATDAAGGVTSYTYDSAGLMATVTSPRGNVVVSNQYDSNNRIIQQTDADGGVFGFSYTLDSNGNVTQTNITDANGSVREMTFGSNGFCASSTFAVGKPEQEELLYTRDPNSNLLLSTVDALNRTTSYSYDSQGNVTGVTRMAGTSEAATTSFTYDSNFNQIAGITDPLGHTWTLTRDSSGNLTGITDPLGNQTTLTYNGEGEPLTITNPAGDKVSFSYQNGDLASVTDPLGNATSFFDDLAGRVLSVTDPLGNTTSFAYDPLDDPTSIVNALGGITSFTYDADRDLTSVTDANGNKTTYTYDPMDRLASRTDALGAPATYSYDGNGNLTQFTDRDGNVTVYQYDGLNRRIFAGYGAGGNGQYQSTINYTWDAGNRLTEAVDSVAGTIQRAYDGLNDLTEEQSPQGDVAYSYDLAGRRTSMTVNGEPTVDYTWDKANRLTGITQGSNSVGFSYDAANRRTHLTLPNGIVLAYTYDADSRITAMNWTLAGSPVGDLEYTYDKDGRVIAKSGSFASVQLPAAVTGNTFNADNEMTSFNGATMTYDADGHLTSDGTNSYIWDARGHLTTLAGANVAAYQYDAFGRRVQNTMNGVMTQYLYDGLNPVEELDGASPANVTATMLTGLGIDEYFARTDSNGTMSYLTNRLGSTLALANSSGTLATQYSYEPFGKTTITGSSSNPFQFTGRENDGTGLYFYRARYYSSALRRFISQDPLGFGGGRGNLYGFTNEDPVNFKDPMGLFPWGVIIPVGTSIFNSNPCMIGRILGMVAATVLGRALGAAGEDFGATIGFAGGELVDPFGGGFPGAFAGGYLGYGFGFATGALGGNLFGNWAGDKLGSFFDVPGCKKHKDCDQ